ncbi:MAG TPA: hypothetical protein VFP88_00590, partial [Rhodanobacteraceae bacterium]|nr:hypothetical protein [Rhodanobacteraceae bacterium]
TMNAQRPRFRNKLMLLCGLLTAGMIAAPGAFARDHHYNRHSGYQHYDRHNSWHGRDHNSNVGALLAGALIGGVIVNAIDNSDSYSRTYYSPPSGYYNDGYGSSGYYNNGYGYDGGGYYDRGYGTTYYGNAPAPTNYSQGYYYGGGY